jgi:hypothetical protein
MRGPSALRVAVSIFHSTKHPYADYDLDHNEQETRMTHGPLPVLVAGATGYVGGRLVPRLLEAGYRPRGLLGLAYWYTVLPLPGIVFARTLAGIRRAAEADAAAGTSTFP